MIGFIIRAIIQMDESGLDHPDPTERLKTKGFRAQVEAVLYSELLDP